MNKEPLSVIKVLVAAASLGFCSVGNATITNFTYYSTDYNRITCNTTFNYGTSTLTMDGYQYASPGYMAGTFATDSADDPRATKLYYIDNNSGSAWSGYDVNVYMDRPFAISNASVTLPGDWGTAVTQPVLNPTPVYFGAVEYVGHVKYTGGTLIPDGTGELDFQYDVGFAGSLGYRFADELMPVFAVPEPGILGLAGAAAMLCGVRRLSRRSARSA